MYEEVLGIMNIATSPLLNDNKREKGRINNQRTDNSSMAYCFFNCIPGLLEI